MEIISIGNRNGEKSYVFKKFKDGSFRLVLFSANVKETYFFNLSQLKKIHRILSRIIDE